jgi:glycosyltransferase involved in cell wall biosynthesis
MACKCLVVGGVDSGAVPYVLNDGEYGVLCNINSTEELFHTLNAVSLNYVSYSDIIIAAFNAVNNLYSPNRIAKKYVSFFENVINNDIRN